MAWRLWAKGGLSPLLRWKTIQCLKGARKAPLKTQCTCELGLGPRESGWGVWLPQHLQVL